MKNVKNFIADKNSSILLFLILNTIVFFLRIFSYSYITYAAIFLEIIAIIAYLNHLLKSEKSKKTLVIEAAIIAIVGIVYMMSGFKYEYLLITYLTVFGSKDIEYTQAIKYIFITQLICMSTVLILTIPGIIPDAVSTKHTVSGHYFTIHSLGFGHGNTFYCLYFNLMAMFLYLYKEKIKLTTVLLLSAGSFVFYLLTFSRTGFVCTLLLILSIYALKKAPNFIDKLFNSKIVKITLVLLEPLLFIFVYLCSTSLFGSELANITNSLITNRINVSNHYIKTFGVHILPQSFTMGVEFDNLYAFSLVSFGWLYNIFISILYIMLMTKLLKKKMNHEIVIICAFLLYGFSERIVISIFRNISIIFYAELLRDKK